MREVFGAVIVIGIVLVAVFVPVAFFPGTTGPHVSAVLADDRVLGRALGLQRRHVHAGAVGAAARQREHGTQGRFFTRRRTGSSTAAPTATSRVVGGRCGWRLGDAGRCSPSACGRPGRVYRSGAAVVRAGRGRGLLHRRSSRRPRARRSSTRRTSRSRPRRSCMAQPEVLGVFSVAGFSFSGAAPNQG